MDWETFVLLSKNFEVQTKGKELTLVSKCGPVVNGLVNFRGELINIPFQPNAILMRLHSKELSVEEIASLSEAAACCLINRPEF
jgi:hypothetical protein